jgi:hypothetical protein
MANKLVINNGKISKKAWGDVDKSALGAIIGRTLKKTYRRG